MALTDAACIVGALSLSRLVSGSQPRLDFVILLAISPPLWVLIFAAFRLYSPHRLSPPDELRRIISAASVGVVVIAIGSFWTTTFSRGWVASTWLFALTCELATRRGWRWRLHRLRLRGPLRFRTLVVGTNGEAAHIAGALRSPDLGFSVLGAIATPRCDATFQELPVIGTIPELERIIRKQRVECLFVASSALEREEMRRVAVAARSAGVELRLSANLPEILTSRLDIQSVAHIIAISVRPLRLTPSRAAVKRAVDLIVAVTLGIVLAPFLVTVALAVKLTSPGPILFRQRRVTRDGQAFTMYKFRTMRADAREVLGRLGIDPTTPFLKLRDDPRLTPIGRFLRRFSLDELPQLVNVIKGEMSLVGPRPLPAEQVEAHGDLLAPRHEVRAGITGWWQINGRSVVDLDQALNMDMFYIENWSVTLDIYILAKTAGAVLTGRGAY
jgi:exopolysaccharide biosynthesis polyprenyl glycosylphosphotransferase